MGTTAEQTRMADPSLLPSKYWRVQVAWDVLNCLLHHLQFHPKDPPVRVATLFVNLGQSQTVCSSGRTQSLDKPLLAVDSFTKGKSEKTEMLA